MPLWGFYLPCRIAASVTPFVQPSQKSIWTTSVSLVSTTMDAVDKENRDRELGSLVPVSVEEWQQWGTSSPIPAMVAEVIEDIKALTQESEVHVNFGGSGGKLPGSFKDLEDKKLKEVYKSLCDSEKKLQYFSARQIACRLLGSRQHLCQKCWLAVEDCMCSKLIKCSLWQGIKFWIYMHPKDFLRQNNTGKLLWQMFGIHSAALCLFGIHEHEDIMWNAFRDSGKNKTWFLYPNRNESPSSVKDVFSDDQFTNLHDGKMDVFEKPLNFVLIDGTWSNSAAMYRRLKERWISTRGDEHLPCISLSNLGASVMHKLRPQPAWDRTCTAAAAAGILDELHLLPSFSMYELDKQAGATGDALDVLLDALVNRRLRLGRSIKRKARHNNCI
ncbi:uncharacterized protein LOC122014910 [Zingiber officinale]|uniref:tRNA-uridine aminocarboxypropyltransferase n=1 Tax=Zingiber officinale TaxID=94328 RepID=A0A8J5F9J8_ZINOF|nr:uncharacterized protein LOC122014910 [Zingiber officinale]XP_042427357.1 uncharacterized protein LOC122014910 [Zingiber officinale]XP_042427358.1 uncharacterized protein LOC122014910 [Zingiber officinale]KAG6482887.1 hypothetical protein ZIOFF_059526 [Zingiber officinale]